MGQVFSIGSRAVSSLSMLLRSGRVTDSASTDIRRRHPPGNASRPSLSNHPLRPATGRSSSRVSSAQSARPSVSSPASPRPRGGLLGGARAEEPVTPSAIRAARDMIWGAPSVRPRHEDLERGIPMNPFGRDLNDDGSPFRGPWDSGMSMRHEAPSRRCPHCDCTTRCRCHWRASVSIAILLVSCVIAAG